MTRYIIRKYLISGNPDGRKKAGILLGAAGIFFDLLLFFVKHFAGVLSGSVAVTADAFNNLADAGAHIPALLAFPLGSRKPSRRFPFGCGRLEYLSGLLVACAVLTVGGRMLLSSIEKILSPRPVESSPAVIGILLFSIVVKGYMYRYNHILGERMDAAGLRSVAVDSVCDCFATGAIILSMLIQQATGVPIDGWTGVMVAVCILYAGIAAAKDSLGALLGRGADDGVIKTIHDILAAFPEIRSVEELAVHDYGPASKLLTMRITGNLSPDGVKRLRAAIREKTGMDSVTEITKIE